ncbi:MAG: LysR family transcriptional regulator [Polyangiales bacterium]
MQDMELRAPTELLPALYALLATESVTLAARRMHVGQPAMSRTLEKLREATGDALLVRAGRRLVRTERGSELLPEVEALVAGAARVLAPPGRFVPAEAEGNVTLALGDDMQAMLAGALLLRIRAEAPALDVRVRPLGLDTAREAQRGVVDVGVFPDVRGEYAIPELDALVLSPQYGRRFVCVTRGRRTLSLRAFLRADHLLVSPTGGEGGYVDTALAALGERRRVAVTVPSFQAALNIVSQTDLVATLPEDVTRALAPTLHRQRCPVTTPVLPMCVSWASRFTRDARHRWLRGHVTAALADFGKGLPRP